MKKTAWLENSLGVKIKMQGCIFYTKLIFSPPPLKFYYLYEFKIDCEKMPLMGMGHELSGLLQ